MVETAETRILASGDSWVNTVEVDRVGEVLLDEAMTRLAAPLQLVESEPYEDVCSLLETAQEVRLLAKGYRAAEEALERIRGLTYVRQTLPTELALRMVPHLRVVDLEAYLQEALKAAKLGNVESVDDFVESCLLNEVDYVRRTLSSLPADWYKHDWAVAALLERGRKTRERFAAAKAEAEAQATNEAEE